MTYLDKNGKEMKPGMRIEARYCSGPYGETKTVTGTLKSIDCYSGLTVTLDKAHNYVCRNVCYVAKAGEDYYVAMHTDVKGDVVTFYHRHNDFEHGHETWAIVL